MNTLEKLIRADETRKTRFHTSNGFLCLPPVEIFKAFTSTIVRVVFKKYAHIPWLVYSATSYITPLVSGKRVFEFGSGMSTLWFADRCREVVSAENNPEWYSSVVAQTKANQNVRVIYAESREDYVGAISQAGGRFDALLIDGSYRKECVEIARSYLNPGGMVIVDNTDVDPELSERIKQVFADSEIHTFRGWVPGNLHPNETTVIQNIPL